MYTPRHYQPPGAADVAGVIRAHSFGTLVSQGPHGLVATHLPFLYRADAGPHGTLRTHLARANPQWRDFASGGEVLVIFQGPHGYVSPSWYPSHPAELHVPTWNYVAVHAYGKPAVIEDETAAAALLAETVGAYEPAGSGYGFATLPEKFVNDNVRAIVAIEIPVTKLEGKFKLSQNRSPEDFAGVVRALDAAGDEGSRALAAAMRAVQEAKS
jgi:transcriptional regulator